MSTTLLEVQKTVSTEITRDYSNTKFGELKDLVVLGLTEEAGEVAGLRKRNLRNNFRDSGKGTREEYVEELGDVLWYLAACCTLYGTNLEEIWVKNRTKLEERYGCEGQCELPGTLHGGED